MEKLLKEYTEEEQVMQEFEVTSKSGKTHIIRTPKPVENSVEDENTDTIESRLARLEDKLDQLLEAKSIEEQK